MFFVTAVNNVRRRLSRSIVVQSGVSGYRLDTNAAYEEKIYNLFQASTIRRPKLGFKHGPETWSWEAQWTFSDVIALCDTRIEKIQVAAHFKNIGILSGGQWFRLVARALYGECDLWDGIWSMETAARRLIVDFGWKQAGSAHESEYDGHRKVSSGQAYCFSILVSRGLHPAFVAPRATPAPVRPSTPVASPGAGPSNHADALAAPEAEAGPEEVTPAGLLPITVYDNDAESLASGDEPEFVPVPSRSKHSEAAFQPAPDAVEIRTAISIAPTTSEEPPTPPAPPKMSPSVWLQVPSARSKSTRADGSPAVYTRQTASRPWAVGSRESGTLCAAELEALRAMRHGLDDAKSDFHLFLRRQWEVVTRLIAKPDGHPGIPYEFSKRLVVRVTGGPGCGKSTWIKAHAKAGDLIICPTSLNAEEFNDESFAKDLGYVAMTPEVWLLNTAHAYGTRVFVDEFALAHPGFVSLVSRFSKTGMVFLVGHEEQIRWKPQGLPREETFDHGLSTIVPVDEDYSLMRNRRSNAAIVTFANLLVGSTMVATRPVDFTSPSPVSFSYVVRDEQVEAEPGYQSLVYLQADKKQVNGATVHEFQGQEAKAIMLWLSRNACVTSAVRDASYDYVGVTRARDYLAINVRKQHAGANRLIEAWNDYAIWWNAQSKHQVYSFRPPAVTGINAATTRAMEHTIRRNLRKDVSTTAKLEAAERVERAKGNPNGEAHRALLAHRKQLREQRNLARKAETEAAEAVAKALKAKWEESARLARARAALKKVEPQDKGKANA